MSAHFFAMIHRMRYINRWGLMRNTQAENIQEHSLQVAVIAHALLEIRRHYFPGAAEADIGDVLLLALYHDASEILTGDLPTPVKYFNPEIRNAYRAVESVAVDKLLSLLPDELAPAWQSALSPDVSDLKKKAALQLVKAADRISAYIKCVDEEKAGNSEFRQAKDSVEKMLDQLAEKMPEVDYFMKHFMPSFWLSLDELQAIDQAELAEKTQLLHDE